MESISTQQAWSVVQYLSALCVELDARRLDPQILRRQPRLHSVVHGRRRSDHYITVNHVTLHLERDDAADLALVHDDGRRWPVERDAMLSMLRIINQSWEHQVVARGLDDAVALSPTR